MKVLEHEHPLNLVDLQLKQPYYEGGSDSEEEEDEDMVTDEYFRCSCDRCGQEINTFHRYYYRCTHSCGYSLHKFCAELPATLEYRSHHTHTLILLQREIGWRCNICKRHHEPQEISYRCSSCDFDVDVNCAVAMDQKRIHHPSHPHPLVSTLEPILSKCNACGNEHKGIFYLCTTCSCFFIHIECALLPKTLIIQHTTNDVFYHTHPLTISYSFSKTDQRAKFYPRCRICIADFDNEFLWIYKCEKCRYYAHVDCATSRREPFMSIFSSAGRGKNIKNFEDADHRDLLHLPFPDQAYTILKHLGFRENESRIFEIHQHPLILVDRPCNEIIRPTSSRINSLSCHDPMKKIELLCNGCIRPITTMPFYKCHNEDESCKFVLHDWCTRLPLEVKNRPGHPQHTLNLQTNVSQKFFGVFRCAICRLPCNGFAYSCVECDYHIDVSCGFIPEKITHEAHPNHLLSRVHTRRGQRRCGACLFEIRENEPFSFSCNSCDFALHLVCALLLPETIRHKYDKHPMKLSYVPIENHKSEYFCEICEYELNPECWFYHCYECVQSIHCACAPLILECERETVSSYYFYRSMVYGFMNIKFGGIHKIEDHGHPVSFVQGLARDGPCTKECGDSLQYELMFKCLQCEFVIHMRCCERFNSEDRSKIEGMMYRWW